MDEGGAVEFGTRRAACPSVCQERSSLAPGDACGRAYGVDEPGVVKLLDEFRSKVSSVEGFVRGSHLTVEAQAEYLGIFHGRLRMFR